MQRRVAGIDVVAGETVHRGLLQFGIRRVQPFQIDLGDRRVQKAFDVLAQVHHGRAERRGHAGRGRHDDLRNVHGARHEAGVHRPRAAETGQHEVAWVAAAVDDDLLDGLRHDLATDADHGVRGLDRGQPEPARHGVHGPFGRGAVEIDLPAERGFQTPEQEVGVRHRRFAAARAVTRRAGLRAGAARPHAQRAARIDPADGPAARAHAVDVEHGQDDRHFEFEFVFARDEPLAALDDRHVETRAAHVGADDAALARRLGQVAGIRHAAGRAGLQQFFRVFLGKVHTHDAAAAFQNQQRAPKPLVGQAREQMLEVGRHDRLERGAHRGGDEPAVLAEQRSRLARQHDVRIGNACEQDVAHLPLVRGVDVGIDEAHGDRRNALGTNFFGHGVRRGGIQRPFLFALDVGALRHGIAVAPRNQRFRLLLIRVVEFLAVLAADLDGVAEPVGRDQCGVGIRPFDQGVGGGRRAVDQAGDAGERNARLFDRFDRIARGPFDRLDHTDRPVPRRGEHLGGDPLAARLLPPEQVGERPAHVNADTPHTQQSPSDDRPPPFLTSGGRRGQG